MKVNTFNFLSFLHDCYKGKTHSLLVSKRILTGAKIRKAGTTKGSDENQTTRFRHLESWQKTDYRTLECPGKVPEMFVHTNILILFLFGALIIPMDKDGMLMNNLSSDINNGNMAVMV